MNCFFLTHGTFKKKNDVELFGLFKKNDSSLLKDICNTFENQNIQFSSISRFQKGALLLDISQVCNVDSEDQISRFLPEMIDSTKWPKYITTVDGRNPPANHLGCTKPCK